MAVLTQQIQWLEQQRNILEQAQRQLQQQSTNHALALQEQQLVFKTLQDKHDKMATDYHKTIDALNDLKANAHHWEIKFEKAQGRIKTLEQSLKKAEDNVTLLQDKNLQLTQEKTALLAQLKHPKFKDS